MQTIGATILASAISVIVTLVVTLLFNKLVALPQAIKKQKEEERLEKERHVQEIENIRLQHEQDLEELRQHHAIEIETLTSRIIPLETAVNALPSYRQQSLDIQNQLRAADTAILETCQAIQAGVKENQEILVQRLDRLEKREKNSLRQKILQEHRLFTDPVKNPMRAWSEMEHHSFFKLVEDYEELDGNDYVHSDVLPDMNRLSVIPMSDTQALYQLMQSRNMGC